MKQECVNLFGEDEDTLRKEDMEFRDYIISEYGEAYYVKLMNLPLSYRDAAIQNFKNVYKRKKRLISI